MGIGGDGEQDNLLLPRVRRRGPGRDLRRHRSRDPVPGRAVLGRTAGRTLVRPNWYYSCAVGTAYAVDRSTGRSTAWPRPSTWLRSRPLGEQDVGGDNVQSRNEGVADLERPAPRPRAGTGANPSRP